MDGARPRASAGEPPHAVLGAAAGQRRRAGRHPRRARRLPAHQRQPGLRLRAGANAPQHHRGHEVRVRHAQSAGRRRVHRCGGGEARAADEPTRRRVGAVERRVGVVERRVGAGERRVGAVERRVGVVERRVGAGERRVGAVVRRVGSESSLAPVIMKVVDSGAPCLSSALPLPLPYSPSCLLAARFRSQYSTDNALLSVTDQILAASDKGQISLLCLLDLSKCFDVIDHELLLEKTDFVRDRDLLVFCLS